MHKLALMFFSCLLMSCNQDGHSVDKNQENPEEVLVGIWKLVDWYNEVPIDINGNGDETTDLFSQWDGCRKQSLLVLSEDGTTEIVYIGENDNPKCPSGFETNDSYSIEPWSYDEQDQSLIFTGDDYIDSYSIIELSDHTLVLDGSGFITCCDFNIDYYTGGFLKFERN